MGQQLNMVDNNYDLKKPIIENFIDQCESGEEFKLRDDVFAELCRLYGYVEENEMDVMQMMADVPKAIGEFVRIPDGWVFLTH